MRRSFADQPVNRPVRGSVSPFTAALGLGVVAGMRSMTAPFLLTRLLQRRPSGPVAQSGWRWLQQAAIPYVAGALAGGELVGDKLPTTPDRTEPVSVLGRTFSGALVGAALYKVARKSAGRGAVVGGLGALAGLFGAFYVRREIGRRTETPDVLCGLAEDALALTSGELLLRAFRPQVRRR